MSGHALQAMVRRLAAGLLAGDDDGSGGGADDQDLSPTAATMEATASPADTLSGRIRVVILEARDFCEHTQPLTLLIVHAAASRLCHRFWGYW